jgi:hypothetical protein
VTSEAASTHPVREEVMPVLRVDDAGRAVDVVASEFGVAVDEDGLAGREVELVDPDGNRLRVATPRA